MGFECLLELRVDKLPSALAYWVVDSFDAASCDLKLVDGRRLHIDEEDVYRVFGFPTGTRKIEKIKRSNKTDIVKEWQSMVPGGMKWMVNAKDLKTELVNLKDGGLWFKRNFIILLASALIEGTTTGYVFPYIMECMVDMDRIAEWNWCEYVMQSLVDSTRAWQGDQTKPFYGTTLFLMMVYVDRVSIFNKKYSRKFPTIGNWDYKSLKAHELDEVQNGGFGRGAPLDRIAIESEEIQQKIQDKEKEKEIRGNREQDQGTSKQDEQVNLRNFVHKMIERTESVAIGLVELYDMIPNAPEAALNNEVFRKTHEAVHKLIGNVVESPTKPSPKEKETENNSDDDSFWNNVANMRELEAIEEAALKKIDYMTYVNSMPSFSLGLTQEEDTIHGPDADFYTDKVEDVAEMN